MNPYELKDTEKIISPALIYYENIIRSNILKAIEIAGTADRLWPHVKSHKSADMLKIQMEYGISKFKTATVAEAEMAAEAGASHVILAYPLVGPNQERLVRLAMAYPDTCFYAVEDDREQLKKLADLCLEMNYEMKVLIDVNMGMNRTGVSIDDMEKLYRYGNSLEGILVDGLHCYDGNHNNKDIHQRMEDVKETDDKIKEVIGNLQTDGIPCEIIVAGGTPSFPCHAALTDWYLSPGTAFITDAGYYQNLPDLPFVPGAAVMTRVISHPTPGVFTTDLGYKGIAADPVGQRGFIVGMEYAVPVIHSEEHWAFKVEDESQVPSVGSCLYVIPTHICPTSALYPEILTAEEGQLKEAWPVTARNRRIHY